MQKNLSKETHCKFDKIIYYIVEKEWVWLKIKHNQIVFYTVGQNNRMFSQTLK